MTFGERLQGEAFLPESVNANKDDRKAAVKVPDRVKQCRIRIVKRGVPDRHKKFTK